MNPLLILIAILVLWNLVLTFLFLSQQQFFKTFTKGVNKNDLKTILKNIASSIKKLADHQEKLQTQTNTIILDNKLHLQKVGFLRFNPYAETGGNQSFCVCLLDQENNGVMITSLHSRDQTRMYAKAIIGGQSQDSSFFKEEKQALQQAMNLAK
jgi:hypothetical protein